MAFMDKFINYMKLDGEDSYDDEYDDVEEEDPTPTPSKPQETYEEHKQYRSVTKPMPSRARKPVNLGEVSVCVFKPTSVDESHEIMQTFKENKTLVLNLEEADSGTAQRILDFTSGCCFALGGSLQKISNYIFIATPASVDISGDLQDTLSNFL